MTVASNETNLQQDVTFREHNRDLIRVANVKIVACEAKPQQKEKDKDSAAAKEKDDVDDPGAAAGPSGGGVKRKH